MNKLDVAETKAMEARMKYRGLLNDILDCLDGEIDDDDGDALWSQLRAKNPRLFDIANFHARGLLHIQEADTIEAREASGAESPSSLHHLAAGSFAQAWAFAEQLGDDDLVAEVLRDAKSNAAVYAEAKAKLAGARDVVKEMRGQR